MTDSYNIQCNCGAIKAALMGTPKVRGHCHCGDCRELLDVPYHSVTAWDKEQLSFIHGQEKLVWHQHPHLNMKRVFCPDCGETLFNTNAMDWRVVSQHLIAKSQPDKQLPEQLQSMSHFFYDRRIVNVDDDLPKKS